MIPRISRSGPGYQIIKMPKKLRDILLPWFESKQDAIIPSEHIPGGYTNNEVLGMTKLDMDKFPDVRAELIKEMTNILQWWCDMRLRHTSTYGVRIYRRDSMLIDHVDRMDTHLASAVLQIAQDTDVGGGWPLEVLLPNKTVGEVYLQPGEMVLYEGAWIRHGRPMRFKGDSFANIFTHFAPVDWKGPTRRSPDPNAPLTPMYYGYEVGRCETIGDGVYPGGDIPKGCTVTEAMEADWRASGAAPGNLYTHEEL